VCATWSRTPSGPRCARAPRRISDNRRVTTWVPRQGTREETAARSHPAARGIHPTPAIAVYALG
jgi:hypothetical protein